MKSFLLFALLLCSTHWLHAQNAAVSNLPPGRYITLLKPGADKWERGDIILLNNNTYRISGGDETGEYRTSITAQRIFFTSGPLRGAFARLIQHNGKPAIELPQAENSHQQLAAADVIAVLKQ